MLNIKNYPLVSLCTITSGNINRLNLLKKVIDNFNYPKNRIEWIILSCGEINTNDENDTNNKIDYKFLTNATKKYIFAKYYHFPYHTNKGQLFNAANKIVSGNIIFYLDEMCYYFVDKIEFTINQMFHGQTQYMISGADYVLSCDMDQKKIYRNKYDFPILSSLVFTRELLLAKTHNKKLNNEKYDDKFIDGLDVLRLQNSVVEFNKINTNVQKSIDNLNKVIPQYYADEIIQINTITNKNIYGNADNEIINQQTHQQIQESQQIQETQQMQEKKTTDIIIFTSYIGSCSWYENIKIFSYLFDGFKIEYNVDPNKYNSKYIIYDSETICSYNFNNINTTNMNTKLIFLARDYKDYSYLNVDFLIDCKKYNNMLINPRNYIYIPKYVYISQHINRLSTISKYYKNRKRTNRLLYFEKFVSKKSSILINLLLSNKFKIDIINSSLRNVIFDKSFSIFNNYTNKYKPLYYLKCIELFSKYKFVICIDNLPQNNNCTDYVSEKIFLIYISGAIPIYIGSQQIKDHINDLAIVNFTDNEIHNNTSDNIINNPNNVCNISDNNASNTSGNNNINKTNNNEKLSDKINYINKNINNNEYFLNEVSKIKNNLFICDIQNYFDKIKHMIYNDQCTE